jgi:flagellar basal-body rod protein FlgC
MTVAASNIANAETTNTPTGGPYRRTSVVFSPIQQSPLSVGARTESAAGGVQVHSMIQDQAPPRMVHDPNNPDADPDGNVAYPNVDLVTEMSDMLAASRAYEASVTMINVSKSMAQKALEIGRL